MTKDKLFVLSVKIVQAHCFHFHQTKFLRCLVEPGYDLIIETETFFCISTELSTYVSVLSGYSKIQMGGYVIQARNVDKHDCDFINQMSHSSNVVRSFSLQPVKK